MEKKNLAKKIALALLCAAAAPSASHAVDLETSHTYLAAGCAAANGQSRGHACGAGEQRGHACGAAQSCAAQGQPYRGQPYWEQSCAAQGQPYQNQPYRGQSCAAQGQYRGQSCGATPNNMPQHPGNNSMTNQNQNPYGQTSYTGTSTGPGPNDGYPATPPGTSSTRYSTDPANTKNHH